MLALSLEGQVDCIVCRNSIEWCSCICGCCGEIKGCDCYKDTIDQEESTSKNNLKLIVKTMQKFSNDDSLDKSSKKLFLGFERKRLEKWQIGRRRFS